MTQENLNFLDSDRILLTHIEDIEDIEGDVWQEVFGRINEQIQSHIDKYNIKFQQSKVEELYFVSNRVKVKNFLAGLNTYKGDMTCKPVADHFGIKYVEPGSVIH